MVFSSSPLVLSGPGEQVLYKYITHFMHYVEGAGHPGEQAAVTAHTGEAPKNKVHVPGQSKPSQP